MNLNRDLDIIISICESLVDDDGLYDELDDKNEYGVEDEGPGPYLENFITVGDITLQRWITQHEYKYMVVNNNQRQNMGFYDILDNAVFYNTFDTGFCNALAYIIDNSDKMRTHVLKDIQYLLNYFKGRNSVRNVEIYSEVYRLLTTKQMQSNPDMVAYLDVNEIFELFGNQQ